jgi:hypothetical protein
MPYRPPRRIEVSTACEMSVSRAPARAAASPSHIAPAHTSESRAASGVTFPTPTVIAESACHPSTIAPKSMDSRSPSRSFSAGEGMPWTTRSLTDAQMTAGYPW